MKEENTTQTDASLVSAAQLMAEIEAGAQEAPAENREQEQVAPEPEANEPTSEDSTEPEPKPLHVTDELAEDEDEERSADELEGLTPEEKLARVLERETELEARTAQFDTVTQSARSIFEFADRILKPESALAAFHELAEGIRHLHGFNPLEAAAVAPPPTADVSSDDWQEKGFEYESDYRLYQRALEDAKAAVNQELQTKYGPLFSEVETLKATRARESEQAQFNSFVQAVAPKTIKAVAATDVGWQVTPEMVSEALKANPHLREEPVKAVKQHFSDERAKHYAATAAKSVAKGPELVSTSQSRGKKAVAPGRETAADIYRELIDSGQG